MVTETPPRALAPSLMEVEDRWAAPCRGDVEPPHGVTPAATSAYSTAELERGCAEEIGRYLDGLPVTGEYGLALFRRAIIVRDEAAWTALFTQYGPLVRRWLGVWAPAIATADGVAATFTRFWRSVDAAKLAHFNSLAAVLGYLKLCARAQCIEQERARAGRAREDPWDDAADSMPGPFRLEERVLQAEHATAFWQRVHTCLCDERERTVIYLSYVRGLPPREICARYSAQFPDITAVYTCKRRALDRLRRSPALRAGRADLEAAS